MYNIIVKEQVNILDKQIPILLGGFGENEIVLSDKNIANVHGVKSFHIRENVKKNIERFTENIDIIDLQKVIGASDNNFSLDDMGYTKMEQGKSKNLYIFSRRGYLKLIKIMNTDKAWEVYEEMLDKYFTMEDKLKNNPTINLQEYIDGKFTELQNQINNLVLQRKTETLSNITEGFNTNNPIQNFFQSIGLDYKTKEEWQNDIKQIKYTEDEILKWKTKQKAKLNDFRKAHKDFKLCTSSLFLSEIYNTMKTKYDISMEDYEKGGNKKRLDIVARDDKLRECFELSIKEVFENPENFYKPNAFTNIETEDIWRDIIVRITSVILFNDTNKAIKYHFNLKEFLVNEFCASLFEENLSYLNAFNKIYTNSGLKYELENFIIKYYNDILKDRANKTIEEFVELLTNNTELYVNFMFGDEVVKF